MAKWYEAIHPAFAGTTPPTNHRFRAGTVKTDVSGAKFLYAPGVGSLAKGDWVVFNAGTYAPALLVDTPLTGQVGIACAANTSTTSFSWYMVFGATTNTAMSGLVNIATSSVDKKPIAQTATPGRALGTGVVATKTVVGAWAIGISASNLGNALLNFPSCAGGSLA